MKQIDLNADVGEGMPTDEALLGLVTSANICCGAYAGSLEVTAATIRLCNQLGVRIGAHPGFPDRASMGRKAPADGMAEAFAQSLLEQAHDFLELCRPAYWKPHGALYSLMAAGDPWADRAAALAGAFAVPLMMLPAGIERLPHLASFGFIREGFADRAYASDGTLLPRSGPGAVLSNVGDVRANALQLAPRVDSICIHGDTPNCVQMAGEVRSALLAAGYELGA